jgi:flavin reductase (DIM6/NTAB) family NADH-FMN oxidoreductase RutF
MEEVLFFGNSSGRNSDKMKQHKLTSVQTPNGNMAYKEAFLIIECELSQISTVSPNDFYFDDMKKFIDEAYIEANDYHKMVFGKIKSVWKKKK